MVAFRLRSPKAPDNNADMEVHEFTYGLMPHLGKYVNVSDFNYGWFW